MLNLHLLRIFNTVVEQGNFSRAAEVLYISQPGVSQAIQELERQLDISLLIRTGRKVKLTEAGLLLYGYTKQILATERAAEQALEQMQGLKRGQLAIGASSTIGIYLLPKLLGIFHQKYSGLRLLLTIGTTNEMVDKLMAAEIDTAFVEGPVSHPQIADHLWREDTLVVIASPKHRLATEAEVTLTQLADEAFVVREPESGTRQIIDAKLNELGFERKTSIELGSTEAVKQAVINGLGIAIIPANTISSELALGQLTTLAMTDLVIKRPLRQLSVIGRPASPALKAFYALVETEDILFSS